MELPESDRIILTEWQRLKERTCSGCGRPLALHKQEVEELREDGSRDPEREAARNYTPMYLTCPALVAQDVAQISREKADREARERGENPERARHWITVRRGEPLPDFD